VDNPFKPRSKSLKCKKFSQELGAQSKISDQRSLPSAESELELLGGEFHQSVLPSFFMAQFDHAVI